MEKNLEKFKGVNTYARQHTWSTMCCSSGLNALMLILNAKVTIPCAHNGKCQHVHKRYNMHHCQPLNQKLELKNKHHGSWWERFVDVVGAAARHCPSPFLWKEPFSHKMCSWIRHLLLVVALWSLTGATFTHHNEESAVSLLQAAYWHPAMWLLAWFSALVAIGLRHSYILKWIGQGFIFKTLTLIRPFVVTLLYLGGLLREDIYLCLI